jgi:putative tricarboxylic transport membrane protein
MIIRHWRADFITASAMLAAEAGLFWNTFYFARSPIRGYPGAGFFPRIVLVFLMVFTITIMIRALAARRADSAEEGEGGVINFPIPDFAITLTAGIAFAILMPWAGFELTLFVIMLALLVPRLQTLWSAVLASVATVLVTYAVFVLSLGVSAPLTFLPQFVSF